MSILAKELTKLQLIRQKQMENGVVLVVFHDLLFGSKVKVNQLQRNKILIPKNIACSKTLKIIKFN